MVTRVSDPNELTTPTNRPWRLLFSLVVPVLALLVFWWSFGFMRNEESPKYLVTLVAVAVGVSGVWVLFWVANDLLGWVSNWRIRESIRPYIFFGPALLLLTIFLIYPVIHTIVLSLMDNQSELFVGFENYGTIFSDPAIRIVFRNNALWLVTVTSVCVALGLLVAVLVDRIRLESLAKSLIFLPMAISAVGASVIWRFVYAFQPAGRPQIGLFNAVLVALGGEPTGVITRIPYNNFALIVIMIWLQTGFCMVVFSAAIKGVPEELLEAARIDGASESQIFFRILIPYIRATILTVATTVLIAVLKVFDIVYVMSRGNYETEVIANRMYLEMYRFRNFGRGSALAVILFLAVVPAIVINLRNLRQQRS